jgi:methyl-accepting chemotaxis protein
MKKYLQNLPLSKRLMVIPLTATVFLAFLGVISFSTMFLIKSSHDSSHVFFISLCVSLFLILLGVFTLLLQGIALKKTIIPPIKKMVDNFKELAEGDMTNRFEASTHDEIGEMGRYFNAAMEKLHDTIIQFAKSCIVLSTTANTLDNNSKDMRTSVDEIVLQVNPVASSAEEMSITTAEIAKNCAAAVESSSQANNAAVSGESIVIQTIEAMTRINGFVEESAKIIERLGNRSDKIGEAVNIIENIAFQTNILALNATIEAARAGEAGKGFAIVADEVKKLARQTTEATENIGETIEAVKSEINLAVTSMEEGLKIVESGVEEARKSGEALKDILEQINHVTNQISQIADSSEGQSTMTEEIAKNVQQISEIIREATKSVGGNAESATRIANLSTELKKLMGQFKLATTKQAEEMVNRAYAYIKKHGKEKALAEFNNPSGEFVKGELFIFCQDFSGTFLAYGGNQALVGLNQWDAKDAKGKYLGRDMVQIAKTKGSGWYEYYFKNPFTEKIQPKITYVRGVDGYYIACGVYRSSVKEDVSMETVN